MEGSVKKITSDSPKLSVSAACFFLFATKAVRSGTNCLMAGSLPGTSCPALFSTHRSRFVFTPGGCACAPACAPWRLRSRCLCSAWKCFARPHTPPAVPERLAGDLSYDEAIWFDLLAHSSRTGVGVLWPSVKKVKGAAAVSVTNNSMTKAWHVSGAPAKRVGAVFENFPLIWATTQGFSSPQY